MSTQRGQVIFKSSRHVLVLVGEETWRCELRGLLRRQGGGSPVVGDWVEVSGSGDDDGRVDVLLPRRNSLSRKRKVGGGRELILAANLDQVVAVFATQQPRLKFGALDRVLIAAELEGLAPSIVINKLDLGFEKDGEARLDVYRQLGYPVLTLSSTQGIGVEAFHDHLLGSVSVVTGPSGVGKSSLLQPLFPDREIRVGEVSQHNEKGRHTTTAATWYPLPGGGAVVDTPGFREYALWGIAAIDIVTGMPDLARFRSACRYSDCLHDGEPECAVKEGVEAGDIAGERYHSYLGILHGFQEDEGTRSAILSAILVGFCGQSCRSPSVLSLFCAGCWGWQSSSFTENGQRVTAPPGGEPAPIQEHAGYEQIGE